MSDISDHLPIFINTDLNVYKSTDKKNNVEVRKMTSENIECFKERLNNVDWQDVCTTNCSIGNDSYSNFIDKFNELYEESFPLKKVSVSSSKKCPNSPWISFAILRSIRRKNTLYRKFIKKPTSVNSVKYKKYRNILNRTLRLAKQKYYSDLLEQEKCSMRNTWKIINSIIRSKCTKCSEKFVIGNKTYTCPIQIASEFNKYFANIGSKLASTIQHTGNNFSHYLKESNKNSCFFRPTNEDEVMKIII